MLYMVDPTSTDRTVLKGINLYDKGQGGEIPSSVAAHVELDVVGRVEQDVPLWHPLTNGCQVGMQ